MKPFFHLSPRQQKWGLFLVLAGALGFNLSMNPEHFNNIARNEGFHSMDLAQTADPKTKPGEKKADDKDKKDDKAADKTADKDKTAEKADSKEKTEAAAAAAPANKDVPPGEEGKKTFSKRIAGAKGVFRATVYEENEVAYLNFEALGKKVEGQNCELCGFKDTPLNLSIDKTEELTNYIQKVVDGKIDLSKISSAPDETKRPQKKGEATEVDIAEWAEKCEKASVANQLSCHKSRLIELSKYLKNSSETEHFVTEYFTTYLQASLKKGMNDRSIKEVRAEKCEGSVLYPAGRTNSFISKMDFDPDKQMVGCYSTEDSDKAEELATEIMSGLRAGNGKGVASLITKLHTSSTMTQLTYAQQMAREGTQLMNEGQKNGDMYAFNLGQVKKNVAYQTLNPNMQMSLLSNTNSELMDAAERMQGTADQKDLITTLIERSYYQPVGSVLTQMRQYMINGNPANPNQSRNLEDFLIAPGVAMDTSVPSVDPNYNSGNPGNVPATAWASRLQPGRGSTLQPPAGSPNWLGARTNLLATNTGAPTFSVNTTPGFNSTLNSNPSFNTSFNTAPTQPSLFNSAGPATNVFATTPNTTVIDRSARSR
jgi:hypothetical protein